MPQFTKANYLYNNSAFIVIQFDEQFNLPQVNGHEMKMPLINFVLKNLKEKCEPFRFGT